MSNGKHKKQAPDPMDDVADVRSLKFLDTGKYFRQKAAEHRYIQLEEDVFRAFPNAKAVNEALRAVLQIQRLEQFRGQRKTA